MRKLVMGILAATAMMAGSQANAANVIRIGTEAAYAPFEYKDDKGELKGMEIDLAKVYCERLKAKCEFVNMDFDSLIPALKAGKIDTIISQMSITAEREKTVDFTDLVTIAPTQFVAKKGSGIDGTKLDTFKGKTIGVQSGTTHETYVNQKLAGDVQLKVYQGLDDAWLDLEAGRVDIVFADATIDYDWLDKTGKAKGFELAGGQINDAEIFGEGTGMAVRKGDTKLRGELNKVIAETNKDGTFKKINDKYFPFNIGPKS